MAKKASRTKNSIFNIGASIGGQLLSIILNFTVRTVFINTLGKEYLGLNGLFSSILTMLSLTELGFGTAISFKLYKPLADGDDKRVRVLMKFYKKAYRVVGATIFTIGICLIPTLPFIIKDYNSLTALGVNATLIFMLHILRSTSSYLFFAYRSAIMRANQKKYILDLVGYVITLLTSVVKIIVLVIWKDFVLYTATVIVFNILQNLINAIIAKRYYPQFFSEEEENISKEEVKDLLKDCGALFIYKVNGVVLKASGNAIISIFLGLASVGLYSNYFLIFTTTKNLLNKIYSGIQASVGNLFATESMEKKYHFFQTMNFLTVILFGTIGTGIAICADELITGWIGNGYVIAKPFSFLIGIETVVHGLKLNLQQIRNISGAFRQMWYRPLMGILINIAVSIWLVRAYGIYGIIIGMITADVLTYFTVDPHIIHKYSFNNYRPVSEYYKKNLLYIIELLAIVSVDMWLCHRIFVNRGWLSVILHGMIVLTTVPGVFFMLYWKSHECVYIRNTGKNILKRLKTRKARQ